MLKFFRIPFATSGDRTSVPDALDPSGNVSYAEGYGLDYQRDPATDPAAKDIERDKMNALMFDMTTAVGELQATGIPDFITSALNGGTDYSYSKYAVVRYSSEVYISLKNSNTSLPSVAADWALLPTPERIQRGTYVAAAAGGTANALTATFVPAIAALPTAPTTLTVWVRAASANSTTTPTFSPDGLTAKTIVKGNNSALAVGDIAGAGHWLLLNYDATLDKWVLANPALGIVTATVPDATETVKGIVELATTAEAAAGTDTTRAVTAAGLAARTPNASTSAVGLVELATDAEAQAGTDIARALTAANLAAAKIINSATVATTSGTSVTLSTTVPSWAKRITLSFNGVSTAAADDLVIQIGNGSFSTSGYRSGSSFSPGTTASFSSTAGYALQNSVFGAGGLLDGLVTLQNIGSNTWIESHILGNVSTTIHGAGSKALGGTLDRVLIKTNGGVDTFDAGAITITWE